MLRQSKMQIIIIVVFCFGASVLAGAEKTLPDAFRKAGFNPEAEDSFYFTVASDIHYGRKEARAEKCFPEMLREMTAYSPASAFFVSLGDMISNGSVFFGHRANKKLNETAVRELTNFRTDLSFLGQIPYVLVIGNHETTAPDDFQCELVRSVFPALQPYHSFDVKGVHFIVLNGGHAGYLDDAQTAWLEEDLKQVKKGTNVVFLQHQPVGRLNAEWQMHSILRDKLDHFPGEILILAGHNHTNRWTGWQLPSGKIILEQQLEWSSQNPVHWIFCVQSGQVTARIFRNRQGEFEVYPIKPPAKIETWKKPFEGLPAVAEFYLRTPEFKVHHRKGSDCYYYFFYLKELDGVLDLGKVDRPFDTLRLTTDFVKEKKITIMLSTDGENFIELPVGPFDQDTSTMPLTLPENFRKAKQLFFKLRMSNTNNILGAFALTAEEQ